MDTPIRPVCATDDILEYFDYARETGRQPSEAQSYAVHFLGLSEAGAEQAFLYWMQTFSERHAPQV